MSGICGIVFHDKDRQVERTFVLSMLQALPGSQLHKGLVRDLGSVGIGVTTVPGRLTGVVDLVVNGHCCALAFYGDLYNGQELCMGKGQKSDYLRSLLHLYLNEGVAFLRRLRGEFVLALWDEREETLSIATDRFRVCPLIYYQDKEKFAFASHMQGILACPLPLAKVLHPEAIVDVVASSVIPTPKTIFQDVKKLPPGHVLNWQKEKGVVSVVPYWGISFLESDGVDETELARKLRTCFSEAVAVRLAQDGEAGRIGTFLSGGVDSSTVTGVVGQLTKRPVKSFSIGFAEQPFNEISYARIAAQSLGAEHYEYFVTPADTCKAIPVILEAFDEPFANASAVPTYFCAKLAQEHGVEVLYAGDGGDELFAGNERYAAQRVFDYYYKIPTLLREHFVRPLIFALAGRLKHDLFIKGKKYIDRASIPYPERLSSYGFFRAFPLAELFEENFLEQVGREYDPYALINMYYHQASARTELDRQLYIDLKLAISDNDLFKVTRMTEAAGVIVRFPFLDHRLAEFAATVPASIKMRGQQLRTFFKKAYADLLPVEVRTKKKHGFGLPIPVWLRTDQQLNEMMHDLVLSPRSIQRGYFRKSALETLIEHHKTDQTSFYGTILWNLMILELWQRAYESRWQSNSVATEMQQWARKRIN